MTIGKIAGMFGIDSALDRDERLGFLASPETVFFDFCCYRSTFEMMVPVEVSTWITDLGKDLCKATRITPTKPETRVILSDFSRLLSTH